jgi:hypothetical protein
MYRFHNRQVTRATAFMHVKWILYRLLKAALFISDRFAKRHLWILYRLLKAALFISDRFANRHVWVRPIHFNVGNPIVGFAYEKRWVPYGWYGRQDRNIVCITLTPHEKPFGDLEQPFHSTTHPFSQETYSPHSVKVDRGDRSIVSQMYSV